MTEDQEKRAGSPESGAFKADDAWRDDQQDARLDDEAAYEERFTGGGPAGEPAAEPDPEPTEDAAGGPAALPAASQRLFGEGTGVHPGMRDDVPAGLDAAAAACGEPRAYEPGPPPAHSGGPSRDYGPDGLGDPGYGHWDYRAGNTRGGYARNYGEHLSNAYRDPRGFEETDPYYDHTAARARARGELPMPERPVGRPTEQNAPWQIPGPMTGRGPRAYRRGDRLIFEDINDRLTDHADIDATDVEVTTQDGEVTLSGSVSNREQRRLAEDIAFSVPGVRDVHNRLSLAHSDRDA